MARHVDNATRFKRDLKRIKKRGKDTAKLQLVVHYLREGVPLPSRYRDHPLTGNWIYHRECHIEPDWLLIYLLTDTSVRLIATGTHADLFE